MDITYHGHSCFKLTGKSGTVVCDPFDASVGLPVPKVSADLVTVSHNHPDHNAYGQIGGTARRDKPFIITELGEYEVGGISVFGVGSHHDANGGVERGTNNIYTILIDSIRVCHLGDLGHELTPDQIEAIGQVDVLLIPVGGVYSLTPDKAVKTIAQLEPLYAVPMHYRTPSHNGLVYGEMKTLEDFEKEYGAAPEPITKLSLDKAKLPEEETQLVVFAG